MNTPLISDLSFIRDINSQKPIKPPSPSISKFISEKRIMPPGTPIPGPVDLSLTPYAIEWMDNMSPYSPIQHQVIMKAAQVAATFTVECIIGYFMHEFPTAIMYLSATQALLEKWGSKRLEPMIDSCGVREKIIENTEQKFGSKSRRTGDKTFSKQFVGGFLEMASAQSPASLRSESVRLLIRDEIDGAPRELTTGEGNWLDVSKARTKFWGDRKKITDLSTPKIDIDSSIAPAYEDGDKRHFFIPCPLCGKEQSLEPIPNTGNHGLRGETKAGKLINVYYLCDFCHDAFFDHSKYSFLNAGIWQPTSISKSSTYRSYYINSLYSPPNTFSWFDYYIEYINSVGDPEKERTFINLSAGLPYTEKGRRPELNEVQHLRGSYKKMTIPEGVLFLTAAIDVQRGSEEYQKMNTDDLQSEIDEAKKNKKRKPFPRLEMEILGIGAGYRTWSIGYFVFNGLLNDIDSGAWGKLTEFFTKLAKESTTIKGGYKVPTIKRSDGLEFQIPISLVDARDGTMTETVYSYTQKFEGFYPSMGAQSLQDIRKKGDRENRDNTRRFKLNKVGQDLYLYIISTNYYKKTIYNRSRKERKLVGDQLAGFMDHPKEYSDYYFNMLFAEKHKSDGTFDAGGKRNEALDVKVYNLAAADIHLDNLVNYWRKLKQDEGYSLEKCKAEINTPWVLQWLENITKRKGKGAGNETV